ncbi:hypothetical protein BDF19DRAFT_402003 [Syncephalis fuscata]|nr:hypothetical protein BDF19DRAFT_402003 [Syncephalis fuscata]
MALPVPTTTTTTTAASNAIEEPNQLSRVGLMPISRVALISGFGTFWGFTFGAYLGGRQAGLQYLAENAHRLPRTKGGWYFYHKTKNYRVMLGGTRRGLIYAGRTGALCLSYSGIEAILDYERGCTSPLHSTVAGLVTAGTFATLAKLPKQSFRYAMQIGLLIGVTTGGLDLLHHYIKDKQEQEQEYKDLPLVSSAMTVIPSTLSQE